MRRARIIADSSAVKMEAYGGRLSRRVKSGKTAPKPTPALDLDPSVKSGVQSPCWEAMSKNIDLTVCAGRSDLAAGRDRQKCTSGNVHGAIERSYVAAIAGWGREIAQLAAFL